MRGNSLVKAVLLGAGLTLGLGACADQRGGVGVGVGFASAEPWAYSGYYDGFYGPVYDGYWGTDGFFYYRVDGGDTHWHKGAGNHFRRDAPGEGTQFRPIQGSGHPARGASMPHFPHGDGHQGR